MGMASVSWDKKMVYNEIFIDEITKSGEKALKKEKKEDFREKFKAEY